MNNIFYAKETGKEEAKVARGCFYFNLKTTCLAGGNVRCIILYFL
jgi:hypothetical protein